MGLSEQDDPALAAAVLLGVCVGFLPHNFHPARIFMGDTGSMLLGLLLAYAPISSLATLDPNTLAGPAAYRGGTVNRFPEVLPLLVPAIIMLIPYADLLLAVVRRTRAGMSPFAADKKHLQHRLLDIGHSHRASVLIMYMWAALFAGTVVLLSIMRTKLYVLGIVTIGGDPGPAAAVDAAAAVVGEAGAGPPVSGARRPARRSPARREPGPGRCRRRRGPSRGRRPGTAGAARATSARGAAGAGPAAEAPWPAPGPLEFDRPLRTAACPGAASAGRPGGRRGAPGGRVCRERVWAGPHGKRARAGFLGGRRGLLSPRAAPGTGPCPGTGSERGNGRDDRRDRPASRAGYRPGWT